MQRGWTRPCQVLRRPCGTACRAAKAEGRPRHPFSRKPHRPQDTGAASYVRGTESSGSRTRAGSGCPEGLDGVVPENLAHQVGAHLLPMEREVDGLREAGLRVGGVRAEHQEVLAKVVRYLLDHLAALMQHDRGKETAARGVFQHGVLQALGTATRVVRLIFHPNSPEGDP